MEPVDPYKRAEHFYLGAWRHKGDRLEPVFDPATGEVIGRYPIFDNKALIPEIFKEAKKAQEYWYHEVTISEKQEIFGEIMKQLEECRGELVWTMVREAGKLWKWADAEVTEAIETCDEYRAEIARVYSSRGVARCKMPKKTVRSYRKPKGVVLAIAPWNFPLNIPLAWKALAALAGGNSVVIKPAEQTPYTAMFGVRLLKNSVSKVLGNRAVHLANLVQLIHGTGEITGKMLLESGLYNKVAFTGGAEAGKIVASTAAQNLRESHLELGGHAAMVVLSDFDVERAVREAIRGCLGDSGQRCVSTRVLWINKKNFEKGLSLYIRFAKEFKIGNPGSADTDMGPLISREQVASVDAMVQSTVEEGGLNVLGGYPLNVSSVDMARMEGFNLDGSAVCGGGYYYPPTVLTNVSYGTTAMDKEIFGPVICINSLDGETLREQFEEGVRLINKARQGLSNAILTNDAVLLEEAPFRIESGILYARRGTTGAETGQDFGGVKDSGWGSEGRGIESFTDPMTYYIDLADEPRMAQAGEDEKVLALLEKTCSPFFGLSEPTAVPVVVSRDLHTHPLIKH